MKTPFDTAAALAHFNATDPIMAGMFVHARTSREPLELPVPKPPRQYFASIASSVVSQQISVKAAAAVLARLKAHVGTITPDSIRQATEEELRACGLSGQKVRYLKTNAELWHTIPLRSFKHMTDEEIITELTKLYGVGRWTAEMFLMFSMARPDVFSYGDYGLMSALYANYPLKAHWKRKLETTVNAWAPHRTLASLSLWHWKDNGPTVL